MKFFLNSRSSKNINNFWKEKSEDVRNISYCFPRFFRKGSKYRKFSQLQNITIDEVIYSLCNIYFALWQSLLGFKSNAHFFQKYTNLAFEYIFMRWFRTLFLTFVQYEMNQCLLIESCITFFLFFLFVKFKSCLS